MKMPDGVTAEDGGLAVQTAWNKATGMLPNERRILRGSYECNYPRFCKW